jgi:hypothetical protein
LRNPVGRGVHPDMMGVIEARGIMFASPPHFLNGEVSSKRSVSRRRGVLPPVLYPSVSDTSPAGFALPPPHLGNGEES